MTAVMNLERGNGLEQSNGLERGNGLDNGLSLERGNRLDDARDTVREDDCGKWDVSVARDDLRLCYGYLTSNEQRFAEPLAFSNWATSQFCTRLGIPAPYFRKCPPPLQDEQANYWLRYGQHKPGEKWLLRAKDNDLRAVLSERYSPLDNATLLDELSPLLPDSYRVDWFGLAAESLHLRVVDPQRYREVLPNDALTVGIHIANSEVGYRSVTVDALVYRLVCKNGLIRLVKGKSLMRQRHLHVSEMRFVGVFGEAIENALQESESFLEQLKAATQTPVPDIEGVMEKIAEKWHLSDETQETVKQSLRQEPASQQESLYGLVNAYTAAAQKLPDESRYDLEVLAGQLAEHGVANYAPRRKKRSAIEGDAVDSVEPQARNGQHPAETTSDSALAEPAIVEKSVVELAREMFDAEIVGRIPNGNGNGRKQ